MEDTKQAHWNLRLLSSLEMLLSAPWARYDETYRVPAVTSIEDWESAANEVITGASAAPAAVASPSVPAQTVTGQGAGSTTDAAALKSEVVDLTDDAEPAATSSSDAPATPAAATPSATVEATASVPPPSSSAPVEQAPVFTRPLYFNRLTGVVQYERPEAGMLRDVSTCFVLLCCFYTLVIFLVYPRNALSTVRCSIAFSRVRLPLSHCSAPPRLFLMPRCLCFASTGRPAVPRV